MFKEGHSYNNLTEEELRNERHLLLWNSDNEEDPDLKNA